MQISPTLIMTCSKFICVLSDVSLRLYTVPLALEIQRDSCGNSSQPDDEFLRHSAYPWFPNRPIAVNTSFLIYCPPKKQFIPYPSACAFWNSCKVPGQYKGNRAKSPSTNCLPKICCLCRAVLLLKLVWVSLNLFEIHLRIFWREISPPCGAASHLRTRLHSLSTASARFCRRQAVPLPL